MLLFVCVCVFGRFAFFLSQAHTDEMKRIRWVFSPLIIIEKNKWIWILFLGIYSLYRCCKSIYYLFATCIGLLFLPFSLHSSVLLLIYFPFVLFSTIAFLPCFVFIKRTNIHWITMTISKRLKIYFIEYMACSFILNCLNPMVCAFFECVVLFFRWFCYFHFISFCE